MDGQSILWRLHRRAKKNAKLVLRFLINFHYHNLSFQALEMLHGQDKTNKGKKQSFKNNVLLRNSRISNISP